MLKPRLEVAYRRPDDICTPDFIQLQDYVGPAVKTFMLAFGFFVTFTALCMLLHPSQWLTIVMLSIPWAICFGIFYSLITIVLMVYLHACLVGMISLYGYDSLLKKVTVPLTHELAFELALAAVGSVKGARVIAADETAGTIRCRTKGSWTINPSWIHVSLAEKDGATEIAIATYCSPSKDRLWGPKWDSVIASLQGRYNMETNLQIAEFIKSTPNWDHDYKSLGFGDIPLIDSDREIA